MSARVRPRPSMLWIWLKGLATLAAVVTAAVAVFLIVSLIGLTPGGPEVVVPSVVGRPVAQAQQELEAAGLRHKVGAEEYHASLPEGQVISLRPDALSRARSGREIELTISKGPREIKVPKVVGKSQDEALQELEKQYLTAGNITQRQSDRPLGEVIRQSPETGHKAARGEAVDLVVSGGPDHARLVDSTGREVLFRRIRVIVPAGDPFQEVEVSLHDRRGAETIYDRIHRPGDEIPIDIRAGPGTRVKVRIDRKLVFEKRL